MCFLCIASISHILATSDSSDSSIEYLKSKTGVTDAQLDTKVMKHVFPWWLFKDLRRFFCSLGLSTEAINKLSKLGRRSAMKKALDMWSNHDPSAAAGRLVKEATTYRALVRITLCLGPLCVACDLCQYIKAKAPVYMDKLVSQVN